MRNITFTLILILSALVVNTQAKNIDSLQKQLDTTRNDCIKTELYTNIADGLIQFTGPKTREITYAEADKAIAYVLKAIHYNARNNDTLAIRNNYNCLASAYFIQHKYTQAKWFVLQSNYISRMRKDVPATINSLMQLASIKIAINDYKMAEKDFNEAIVLAKYKNDVLREIDIEKCLATLYDNTGRAKLAVAAEKHCAYLAANIGKITIHQAKENQVRMVEQAKIAAQQAKANAVKMALIAKLNKANQVKIALQKAKTQKAEEKKYLAMLKAKNQWPLLLTYQAKPITKVQPTYNEDVKTETATVFAVMPQAK